MPTGDTQATETDSPAPLRRLFVLGGGNMGGAIVRGAIRAKVLPPNRVVVIEPDEGKRAALAALGLEGFRGVEAIAADVDPTLLLAVKPQMLPAIVAELTEARVRAGCVISVMAGVDLASLERLFATSRVVRTMPNLPAMVGQGCTAIAAGPGARPDDVALAEDLFAAVGRVFRLDEPLMDAFTAVAGSGPAYLYYLAEAMHTAALQVGFEPDAARAIVRQTLVGAASLLAESSESFESLRSNVTSPGGTTEAAVAALDTERVQALWARAVVAARDRGAALAKAARGDGPRP